MFNVSTDVSENTIVEYMKKKELDLMECVQASHPEARTKSFKIRVKAADYELAMKSDTWPYRVRIRAFKHFRQRQQESGTFNEASRNSTSGGNLNIHQGSSF